jgi:hypothetical protein
VSASAADATRIAPDIGSKRARDPKKPFSGVTIEAVSSNVDDKTMQETYLWPFANAVRAGTSVVMCSYQRINGSYGTRLEHLHPDFSSNEPSRVPE